jgi:hypothetical protein
VAIVVVRAYGDDANPGVNGTQEIRVKVRAAMMWHLQQIGT